MRVEQPVRAASLVRSGVSPERTRTSSASPECFARRAHGVAGARAGAPARRPSTSVEGASRCRARRRRRAARAERAGRLDAPSRPCAARGSGAGASRARNAFAFRALRPSRLQRVSSASRVFDGWGARIRTWDHGTKTRCLTTWPRPRARDGQSTPCRRRHAGARASAGRGGARRARARRAGDDHDSREHDERARQHRHEHDDELRDGSRPRDDAHVRALVLPAPADVRRERAEREHDDEPPRDRAREHEDAPRPPRSRGRPCSGCAGRDARDGSRRARSGARSPCAEGISRDARSRSSRERSSAAAARTALGSVGEQPVDHGAGAGDVGTERAEPAELVGERRGSEVVRREARRGRSAVRTRAERLPERGPARVEAVLAARARRTRRTRPLVDAFAAPWGRASSDGVVARQRRADASVVPSPVPSCAPRRRKNGTSAPSDAASRSSTSTDSGSSSRSFASSSAAAASLEPPPRPAATGIRFSMRASKRGASAGASRQRLECRRDQRVVLEAVDARRLGAPDRRRCRGGTAARGRSRPRACRRFAAARRRARG